MEKPLPDVPQPLASIKKSIYSTANWANLTVDGRNHLRRFILHCLEEAQDVIPANESEALAASIGRALDELGERVFIGGWLPGLRRARSRRVAEVKKQRGSLADKRADSATDDTTATPKRNNSYRGELKDDGYFSFDCGEGTQPPEDSATRHDALVSLKALAEKSTTIVPKLTAKHILLTVAPPKVENLYCSCAFIPGIFALPDTTDPGASAQGDVLYGLESWSECYSTIYRAYNPQ
jgi:1-phosphatidylinositol-3-phosphate 5-kinase